MDEIAKWRKRIDEIDEQLVRLLNERAAYAIEIGKVKHEKGMEICNPEREKKVIDHICQQNIGPLDNTTIKKLFECIIEECKSSQKNNKK